MKHPNPDLYIWAQFDANIIVNGNLLKDYFLINFVIIGLPLLAINCTNN
jgi:hypothetical protein